MLRCHIPASTPLVTAGVGRSRAATNGLRIEESTPSLASTQKSSLDLLSMIRKASRQRQGKTLGSPAKSARIGSTVDDSSIAVPRPDDSLRFPGNCRQRRAGDDDDSQRLALPVCKQTTSPRAWPVSVRTRRWGCRRRQLPGAATSGNRRYRPRSGPPRRRGGNGRHRYVCCGH